MSNIFNKILFAAALLGLSSTGAQAIYCSNCATVSNQMRQYIEQVNTQINTAKQLQTQLQQYQDMVKQGMKLSDPQFDGLGQTLDRLRNVYSNSQSLSHNMGNINNQFNELYPGYDKYLNDNGLNNDQYRKWSAAGLDNSRTAIQAAGVNTSTFDDEDQLMKKLVDRSANAEGRMQAIQAGNEISAEQVKQLQLLRELMANNVTLQANYTANQIERQAADDAEAQRFLSVQPRKDAHKGF